MKRIRKVIIFLLITSICTLSTSAYEMSNNRAANIEDKSMESVLTEDLIELIRDSDENSDVTVTIELVDEIDLKAIELAAIENAKLTSEEKSKMVDSEESVYKMENKSYRSEVLRIQDKVRTERLALVEEHYAASDSKFMLDYQISEECVGSVGIYSPFIRNVTISANKILELAADHRVKAISRAPVGNNLGFAAASEAADIFGSDITLQESYARESQSFVTASQAVGIIGGDVAKNEGYTGEGIRVAVIDQYHPNLVSMQEDRFEVSQDNVYSTTIQEDEHASRVCGIILEMAPDCQIYTCALGFNPYRVPEVCEDMIQRYGVHVICLPYGHSNVGVYDDYAKELDATIRNTGVSITVAAGNSSDWKMNAYGVCRDVISVGSVHSNGTNPTLPGAYTMAAYSSYNEATGVINKPDVCAPGNIQVYSMPGESGTSYAAPFAAGIVVQMMDRNPALIDKPETIKAAIIASAYHNAGTDRSYVQGTLSSNQEGAGVVDAEFCYWVARNGRRAHFDTQNGQYLYTRDVWVDTTALPFRIACTWRITDSTMINPNNYSDYDFDLVIYKDGVRVAGSGSWASHETYKVLNYEVIELSPEILQTYGAGTYRVEIWLLNYGDTVAAPGFRIGLAWEQPNV